MKRLHLRLAAFKIGLGLTAALVGGTLNRIMIVELDLPVALVGLLFAIPPLIAPARVWFGYWSDGHPVRGKRREPYILLGVAVVGIGVTGATAVALRASLGVMMAAALALLFMAYGLGNMLASNSFEALLADKFKGAQRPRAVTLFMTAMFIGIIGGSIGLGRALETYSPERLLAIVIAVMLLYMLLAAFAVFRQEPDIPDLEATVRQATETGFVAVIRDLVWPDPQARRFVVLVVLAVMGSLAQEALLEPFGALVFGMETSQTTRLTAIWGAGTMLAMLLAGLCLIGQWGYMPTLRAGLALNVVVFSGMILAGALGSVGLFRALIFALGIGTGLSMAGLLTAVIEFTTFTRAGLLMGVWGMAADFGQAGGSLMGGVVVDTMQRLTSGDHLLAYSAVFALEAVALMIALTLTQNLSVTDSARQIELSGEELNWVGL